MKKIIVLILALILTLGLVGCNGKKVNIDFPFEVEDVESVEMYHYNGAPASAEKKVVVAESDIKTLYDMFKGLSLKDKTAEETAGADVTSFRFNLSDGTSYDLIYACYGAKNGNLKSEAGGFAYFTSADIGSYWNNLNKELEATPVNESELPGAESAPQNDILQVGIRKATAGVYDEEDLKFTWSVENIGDYSVSFDKNMITTPSVDPIFQQENGGLKYDISKPPLDFSTQNRHRMAVSCVRIYTLNSYLSLE